MLKESKGNLLDADVEALVNTVNTVGVMGKGIALQFRQAFSNEYFKDYQRACKNNELKLGKVHIYHHSSLNNPKYIINFPTKKHWKGKSRIEDIELGLSNLVELINRYGIQSIALPPLGCGNGGLKWEEVRRLIEQAFSGLPNTEVLLYPPAGAPKWDQAKIATQRPKMTAGRAALIALFEIYLLPGYQLSQLEIQKLAYFLQLTGEPLKLNFVKDRYGPYAENLHHVLQRIDGHYIKGYGDRTQAAIEPSIELIPDSLNLAHEYLNQNGIDTIGRLEQVFDLISGFEYPHGLELLSTVHWVATDNYVVRNDLDKIINLVRSWNKRKKVKFSPKEIKIAYERLVEQKWI